MNQPVTLYLGAAAPLVEHARLWLAPIPDSEEDPWWQLWRQINAQG